MTRIRSGAELLEKLNSVMDKYDNGEMNPTDVKAYTNLVDSMCRVVKTTSDVQKDSLRYGDIHESIEVFGNVKKISST